MSRASSIASVTGEPLTRFVGAISRAAEAAAGLEREELVEAVGEVAKLEAKIQARLYGMTLPRQEEADRLLDVEEAAGRLGMSTSALYKSADSYSFTVRDGRRLRFSARGVDRWISRRTSP